MNANGKDLNGKLGFSMGKILSLKRKDMPALRRLFLLKGIILILIYPKLGAPGRMAGRAVNLLEELKSRAEKANARPSRAAFVRVDAPELFRLIKAYETAIAILVKTSEQETSREYKERTGRHPDEVGSIEEGYEIIILKSRHAVAQCEKILGGEG